jgi:hypothetical protein
MRETPDQIREPRALWEVVQVTANSQQDVYTPPGRIVLTPELWRNGERNPIVLTHVLLDGVNYLLDTNDNDTLATSTTVYNNARSTLQRTQIFVTTPGAYHWSIKDLAPEAFLPLPAATPSMEYTSTPYASGLLGVTRWDFDFGAPFWLPRRARVQFDLSPYIAYNIGALDLDNSFYSVLFNELPAAGYAERLPGSARLNERARLRTSLNADAFPAGPAPFPVVGFPNFIAGTANDPFQHKFLPKNWDQQEKVAGATHSFYSGFGVLIDQIDYDDLLQTSAEPGVAGQRVAPLASNVSVRARTTNGGSQEWWWRPGCPLSLVSPTLGPALVHELDKPIVLAPGDSLKVELQMNNTPSAGIPPETPPLYPNYQVGVSMLGYAAIEG